MRTSSTIFVLGCLVSGLNARWYNWPLYPVLERYCRGTFCEYRPAHFHEGIDIPAERSGYTVYATTDSFKYIGREYNDIGWIVCLEHYGQSGSNQVSLNEGSRYIHMNNIDLTLENGQIYIFRPIAQNTSFLDNHLHFEMREPAPTGVWGPANIKNSFNPFAINALCAPDNQAPFLVP